MKIKTEIIIPLFLFCCSAFASPQATQSWVRNYVRTNSAPARTDEQLFANHSESFYNETGGLETITFVMSIAKRSGFVVQRSNVEGITNGTIYASIGEREMMNLSVSACPSMIGSVEKYGVSLSDARISVVSGVTNVIYLTTNDVCCMRYTARIGGVTYKSMPAGDGSHYFSPITVSTNGFLLSACKLTDAEYESCITVQQTFHKMSILDLILPSAYAMSKGEKEYVGEPWTDPSPPPEYGEYYVYQNWQRLWYTDESDAFKVKMEAIEWKDSIGTDVKYDIGEVFFEITAGIEYLDLANFTIPTDDKINDIVREKLGASVYRRLEREPAKSAYSKCKENYIDSVYEKYGKVIANAPKGEYPQTGKDKTRMYASCKNHLWVGYCGHYRCETCGSKTTGYGISGLYQNHKYEFPNDVECAYCTNPRLTKDGHEAICKTIPYMAGADRPSYHQNYTDKGPGTVYGDENCVCNCGHSTLRHSEPSTADSYIKDDPESLVCWKTWTCSRCGSNNSSEGYLYVGSGSTITPDVHYDDGTGPYEAVVDITGHPICKHCYECHHIVDDVDLGCGQSVEESGEHDLFTPPDAVAVEKPEDDDVHYISKSCSHGFGTTNWCGYVTNNVEVAHNYSEEKLGRVGDKVMPPDSNNHYLYIFCGDLETGTITDEKKQCGHVYSESESHDGYYVESFGNPQSNAHDVSNRCSVCEYRKFVRTENHIPMYTKPIATYKDNSVHVLSNRCIRIGCQSFYVATPAETNHTATLPSGFCYSLGEDIHAVSNYCGECSSFFLVRTENHIIDEDRYELESVGSYGHRTNRWCKSFPCNQKIHGNPIPHELKWVLSQSWMEQDRRDCPCGYYTNTAHAVSYSEIVHWCANGGNHLMGVHVWDETDTNLCTVCGYRKGATPSGCKETRRIDSPCGDCHITETRTRKDAQSEWGPWIVSSTKCKWGWDYQENRCGCPNCSREQYSYCYCLIGPDPLPYVKAPYSPSTLPFSGSNN